MVRSRPSIGSAMEQLARKIPALVLVCFPPFASPALLASDNLRLFVMALHCSDAT